MRKRRQRLFMRPAVLAEAVEGTPDHITAIETQTSSAIPSMTHYGLGSGRRCAVKDQEQPTTMPGVTLWKGKRKPVTLVPAAMIRNMPFRRGVL